MLEVNKCPICLRTAVDYRHIELFARFSIFFHIPKCSLCWGVPPHHQTPEHRSSNDQVKTLIELINYHLGRSDKPNLNEPLNWKAMTFAFQVHLKRFQIAQIIITCEKLGFPLMNEKKMNDLISLIEKSKIWKFDEVRDEIKLVKQHFTYETNNNDEEIAYFLRCGLERLYLNRFILPKTESQEKSRPSSPIIQMSFIQNEIEKTQINSNKKSLRRTNTKNKLKSLSNDQGVQTRSAQKKSTDRSLSVPKQSIKQKKFRRQKTKSFDLNKKQLQDRQSNPQQNRLRKEKRSQIRQRKTNQKQLQVIAKDQINLNVTCAQSQNVIDSKVEEQFGVHMSSLFESQCVKSEENKQDIVSEEVVFLESRKPRKGKGQNDIKEPKIEYETIKKPYSFRFQTQLQMKQQKKKTERNIEIFVNGQETLDIDKMQDEIRPTITFVPYDFY